ncbi:uncharacterized protein [Engystomops pustulosus]|uniref:uncharacterized protein n=1 Tax=Engystomops pustulosus TaxID=76066 RepID=UPI003AFA50E4
MGTMGPVIWILSALTLNYAFELPTRVLNPAHNDQVCSTWGNFHYKTFDGDIYQFPGSCNYVFASNCKKTFEDFNIQIRRSANSKKPVLSHVIIKIEGLVIEMRKDEIMVGGNNISLPFSQFGVHIQQSSVYVKISAKLGLTLLWNNEDALMLKLSPKHMKTTCGLCGDMNGIRLDEFQIEDMLLTPIQFGNLQKMDGPTEQCEDVISSPPKNCNDLKDVCLSMLSSPAFSDCDIRLPKEAYIEACISDLCNCQSLNDTSCFCDTLAEYSRQCAHAGGRPSTWRYKMCERNCPMNLKYNECGSPCADTCSNSERTLVCEEHCIDGCFCPPGTVFDDINNQGCIPLSECSCTYNNKKYAPGESYSTKCHNCTCHGGQWSCLALPCAGHCSMEGGSHIYTYDGGHYNFHGDCNYIFTKDCVQNMFTVLVELRKCGVSNTETCLKSVTLSLEKGLTVVTVKSSGTILLNGIYARAPLFTENLAVLQPSSFYLIVKSFNGIQIQIQMNPLMQISASLDPEYQGDACGLCGDFNNIRTDDFRAYSGVLEGTASAFANTWKSQTDCANVKDIYENPCSVSVENERFAQHWCSQLSDNNGPFAPCHAAVNPTIYQKNCIYDSCNYEKSEDSVCGAFAAYVRACAAEGVILKEWRGVICDKYTKNCPKNSTYQYAISTCQKTCRSLSEPDPSCSFKFPTVDGCACPDGTYLDESGACVSDKKCPCYYKGSVMPPGEVMYDNGAMCTCQKGRLLCVGKAPSVAACPGNMVYFDCANATTGGKGSECQKTCQTLDLECFSIQCASGCVCPEGLVLNNNGSCIPEEDCPCVHNGEMYQSGETIQQDCNTCTCEDRKWQCTKEECHRTCVVYGEGHYVTFDGKRFDFSGDCEYTLTQDYCLSNAGNGSFRVITENIPCGTTGATCSKAIKVFLGNFELKLSEGSYEVVERDIGSEVPYQVRQMGIYLVIEAKNGLILMWDKKTSILIKLSPEYKGSVCGLCGNYDGSVSNDFTTRSQSVVVNIQEFGNGWKASPTCPDALPVRDPCLANPYRQTWSQKHCSIIMSSTFSKCHSKVDPTPYQEACVRDTCACDSGGDCECYCTAVAAYAAACSQAGICVSWRSPEICPLFCDYYNPEGECEWHYKPCGAPCMKTCRNPSGQCMNNLPGLEGCYPKCPKERPFFDEDIMKCVAQANCGCYDDDGKRYSVGDMVPSYKNCESCICTKKGRRCQMDERACYCYYGNMKYNYGDVIYNTTDGIGGCISATCSSNGTITRSVYPCVPTTKAPTTTFHFDTTTKIPMNISTPEPISSTSVSCLKEVCKWSTWYDVTCPKYGENEGDFETFENIRKKGYSVCKVPSQVECRAQKFPKIPVADLGQIIQCNTSMGLVCYNRDQFSQLCFNYEIRILCCSFVPCGEVSASPTPLITSSPAITLTTKSPETLITASTSPAKTSSAISSMKTTPRTPTMKPVTETIKPSTTKPKETPHTTPCMKEMCTWTSWLDVHFPSIVESDGDFETIENLRAAGNNVCQKPEDIKCRAERYPDKAIEEVGQIVTCNITHGLICKNADQIKNFPLCYNYQVQILCCSLENCEPSTIHVPSTTKAHSTKHSESSEFTRTTPKLTKTTKMELHTEVTTKVPHTVLITTSSTHMTTSSKDNCVPVCEWSQWFDVSFPNSDRNGDFETYEDIRNSGFKICQEPSDIQCRSADIPDIPMEELQQNVQCNVSNGLVCRNDEQTGPFPYCYNYEIRVYCCSGCMVTKGMPTSTKPQPMSTKQEIISSRVTSTLPQTTKHSITSLPSSPHTQPTSAFGKLTTHEDIQTYTPKITKATTVITAPLEKTTKSIPTQGHTTTSEFNRSTTKHQTTESEHEKATSHKTVSMKTTKVSTESGEVTSAFKTTGKTTSSKVTAASHKQTTESQHEAVTSGKPFKTTKVSTESHEITSGNKTTPGQPITSKATSPKETTALRRSTTVSEQEETTSHKPVSMKTTKMPTESGEVTSAFKTTSARTTTGPHKSTTESEHEEVTSGKPVKTTKVSTESHEVTSSHKTTPGQPITSKVTSPEETTALRRSTTESEHEETTSHKPVSMKTTKIPTESGEVTSAFKTTSAKATTAPHKSTTESEHEEVTSGKPVKTTKVSAESHEVTSSHKTTPGQPITSKATSPKQTTALRRSTTESEEEETTSRKPVSMKTTKMPTESGEVTSAFKTTGKTTAPHKSTTESEHEEVTSEKPVKTTKVSTESHEVTSSHKTTPGQPITSKATSPKQTTAHRRSTTESGEEETTSRKPASMKTTKMPTESGEVTSAFKTTGKSTTAKATTAPHKSTTESEHEEVTSGKPVKTTKVSTESHEVKSSYKTTPGQPITSKATYPKETTALRRSTTESEEEETTSRKPVSMKTTKMPTESGEVTSAFKTTSAKTTTSPHKSTTVSEHEEVTSGKPVKTTKVSAESHEVTSSHKTTPGQPMTSKATSPKETTALRRSTTESEHEETTSHKPVSMKTTKIPTESGEVTSSHKTTPGQPITSKATSPKQTTAHRRSTTESEEEETTSRKPVSMKTTKMPTESGEVTSAFKTIGKSTTAKATTAPHKSTTKSEHEEVTSGKPVKTTKVSTESHEVTSSHKTTPGQPITSKATSPKQTTAHRRSTTESEEEETTSRKPVSMKTTKMPTESGEVTSAFKTTGKTTAPHKSTTESEHEEVTSGKPVNTTKVSAESHEVTSSHKTTPGQPMTSKATSPKETTALRRSTTESEEEETTSHKPVSMKTTKIPTESGEVTSAFKTTSAKTTTGPHKSTTESEHEEVTSAKPVKTTKVSTESHEVTSSHKTTPGQPITSKSTSPKETTALRRSTTESEEEETTSRKPVSMKTTKMPTESGEVTSAFKTTGKTTGPHKSTTESEHEEVTSAKPVKTTKVSSESHEVTSSHKTTPGQPITSKATSPKETTALRRSTTESEEEETTSRKPVSMKTTKIPTESGEVTSAFKTTSAKTTTGPLKSTTESEHEEVTSAKPVKTTKVSTESHEVTSSHKTTPGQPITSKATSPKETTALRRSTTESEEEETTSRKPVSMKTTKIPTESGEVTSAFKTTSAKTTTGPHKSTTESEHEEGTSAKPVKTTKVSTESHDVTSSHKTTPGQPITSKATSPKQTTAHRRSTTESEEEETTSHKPVSMKTTKMPTESGEVTSAFKTTSAKATTAPHKSTTESEYEEVTSAKPVKTTKVSTESHEVTSSHKTTPGQPITSKATSPKQTTAHRRSTTESEEEETTSRKPVSMKTTKMPTESGEVTSAFKTAGKSTAPHKSTTESEHEEVTSGKPVKTTKVSTESHEVTSSHKTTSGQPITSKATSPKQTTALRRSTTESEEEETTSRKPVSMKTTKIPTESGEVTSAFKTTSAKTTTGPHKSTTESEHEEGTSAKPVKTTKVSTESHDVTSSHKTTPGQPITSKATSPKQTTAHRRSTTESEEEETTSHKPVSMKTTKMPTESGEVTSAFKTTSAKATTAPHKSTTESEYEEVTSAKPVKTTKVSTESHEVTSSHKTTPGQPITSKATSPKQTTAHRRSTTESEEEETTSRKPVSMKTTKMPTESGEVTSAFKTAGKSTAPHKSTTESEHEEVTSGKPVKTTKVSTESHEVTSSHKTTSGQPITSKATSPKQTTALRRSTTESEEEETTSRKPVSMKTTKIPTESGEVTSAFKTTSAKTTTGPHKSTTESEHEEGTSAKPVKTTKVSTESHDVTSSHKTTPGQPITSKATSPKQTTAHRRSTTESEEEETTSHKPVSMKTTKMPTESGEVTSAFKTTSAKATTAPHKSTTESEYEEVTSAKPVKTTKVSTESHEVTSSHKTTPGQPITSKATSPKQTTAHRRSTTESEEEETTSRKPVSMKTTKIPTESGEVTSAFKTTSAKTTTGPLKSTTESEHEEVTSAKPVKTTKVSTESHEVTSSHKTTPGQPITSKATSPKETTALRRSTTESEEEETTSRKPVSMKTTKIPTESGEVTSAFKTTSAKTTTAPHKSTTESEHEEVTSGKPVKTTKVSAESHEVTSSHKTTPGQPITSKATSPKQTTAHRRSTTESEEEETTSHKPVSMKTTKMPTESGEVTSAFKTTSAKATTAPHKSTTESEYEEVTSAKPVKTTKVSTESHEVTSSHKTTPGQPITSKATSPKQTTAHRRSTTESEEEETTSRKPVSMKTTKMPTESGEVTSTTSGQPITSKATSPKQTTALRRSTTESEEEETTSRKPVSMKTTKIPTESGEVTSAFKTTSAKTTTGPLKSTTESEHEEVTSAKPVKTTKVSTESHEVTSSHKTTPGQPITSKATSPKETTALRRSTTESEEEETTSRKPVSMKTTKIPTESGEVTSAFKTTSAKTTTAPHKSTTESEHEEVTSGKPVKTTKVSAESHEVTSSHKTTPGQPITSKATSPKETTALRRSTTESEQEETTSRKPVSMKTTKIPTESGEVTSAFKTTSAKATTAPHKSTTVSEHEEVTSEKPVKTTKVSTESHEVTSSHKTTSGQPITSKVTSPEETTALRRSTTESEHEEATSHKPVSLKTTKMDTYSQAVSSASTLPTTTGKISTEHTATKATKTSEAVTESFSTTRCMCNVNGVLVPPGQVLYNTTDNAGWCFYARCNQSCKVERYSEQCHSSTVPTASSSTKTSKTVTASTMTTKKTASTPKTIETSTKTSHTSQTKNSASTVSSTSTINPGCTALMPPRTVNETWMIDQCTQARCIGQNNLSIKKKECGPVKDVVCANRLQPKKTFDESGCCYEMGCECVCGGWGTSHYITFDGTYYSFNGQCTYVLVQQITPVFDHFRVYIDNFSCDPDDPTCVKTLRIMYKTETIILKSQSLNKRIINKIYVNEERVYPAIYRNGISITSSGIFVIVDIPEIGAYISFNVLSFTVKLPLDKFSENTEGHCGKCSNNRVDDCLLPNGQVAPSCTQMAGQWGAPSEDPSSCSTLPTSVPTIIPSQSTLPFSSLSPTYFSTLKSSVPQTAPTRIPSTELSTLPSTTFPTVQPTNSDEPCNTPEVCTVILSSVFEECHSVVPPEPYYQACVSDGCTKSEGDILCSSLQTYARMCGIVGVCIDWRDSTDGLCPKNCSSHLEYNPCGPSVEPTCNSKYNDAFFNKTTNDFMEGCYCPEGTTKFNTVSDKCVSTCGCTGPDGMPRQPGEKWDSNCQTCICDSTSMSVLCTKKSCPVRVAKNCSEGYMPISVPDLSNTCCTVTECRCNVSLCKQTKKVCKPGYEAVLQMSAGGCCPVYKCEPKNVCVHNGTEYQPGVTVPSSNPCETCMCDGSMNETTGLNHVSCTPMICDKQCAQGFKYKKVSGKCCGTCEQAECIMELPDNSTYLLKPGDTWSPPGDNCTEYECVQKKDKLLTVASKISCPKINLDECVPETIKKDPNGCCLTCVKEAKKCQRIKTENIILQNGCKSNKPIEMSSCKGSCESYSMYSEKSQSIEHTCACCQETGTEKITIDLTCPNGETIKYSFINVKSCKCADTTCKIENKQNSKEDSEDNRSDSKEKRNKKEDGGDKKAPVTKQAPSITNKLMKTTMQFQGKKDKDDKNIENNKKKMDSEEKDKMDKKEVDGVNVSSLTKKVPHINEQPFKTTKKQQDNKDKKSERSKENESSEQNSKSDSKEKLDKKKKDIDVKVSPVTKQVLYLTDQPSKNTNQKQETKNKKSENSKENESSEQNSKSDSKEKLGKKKEDDGVKVFPVTKQVPRINDQQSKTTNQKQDNKDKKSETSRENESSKQNNEYDSKEKLGKKKEDIDVKVSPVTKQVPHINDQRSKTTNQKQETKNKKSEYSKENESFEQNSKSDSKEKLGKKKENIDVKVSAVFKTTKKQQDNKDKKSENSKENESTGTEQNSKSDSKEKLGKKKEDDGVKVFPVTKQVPRINDQQSKTTNQKQDNKDKKSETSRENESSKQNKEYDSKEKLAKKKEDIDVKVSSVTKQVPHINDQPSKTTNQKLDNKDKKSEASKEKESSKQNRESDSNEKLDKKKEYNGDKVSPVTKQVSHITDKPSKSNNKTQDEQNKDTNKSENKISEITSKVINTTKQSTEVKKNSETISKSQPKLNGELKSEDDNKVTKAKVINTTEVKKSAKLPLVG